MRLTFRLAPPEELERVTAFYEAIIDGTAGQPHAPKWQKGIYPTEDDLGTAIRQGELYLAESQGTLLGAMVMNHRASGGYEAVDWPTAAEPWEVTVLHLLGVLPSGARQGIGMALVRFAIEWAKEHRQRAIRLDVLVGNLPADRLYRSLGFRFVRRLELFYEDTGWHEFDLFEYAIP